MKVQTSRDDKGKTRGRDKTVLLTPPVPRFIKGSPFELVDPAREPDGSSIIHVAMGLGAILFTGAEQLTSRYDEKRIGLTEDKALGGDERILRDLLGDKDERAMLRDLVDVPRLNEGQIRDALSIVLAEFWILIC